jgi:hypothetical protein
LPRISPYPRVRPSTQTLQEKKMDEQKRKAAKKIEKLEDRIAPGGIGGALGDLGVDGSEAPAEGDAQNQDLGSGEAAEGADDTSMPPAPDATADAPPAMDDGMQMDDAPAEGDAPTDLADGEAGPPDYDAMAADSEMDGMDDMDMAEDEMGPPEAPDAPAEVQAQLDGGADSASLTDPEGNEMTWNNDGLMVRAIPRPGMPTARAKPNMPMVQVRPGTTMVRVLIRGPMGQPVLGKPMVRGLITVPMVR